MFDWEELEGYANRCARCALCRTRNHVVFGVGNREADIIFIGEGPGEQEDLTGEPFVGPAGKLLDDMLSIIDLNRTNVYIANIVKCRPPHNRDPKPEEQEACIGETSDYCLPGSYRGPENYRARIPYYPGARRMAAA